MVQSLRPGSVLPEATSSVPSICAATVAPTPEDPTPFSSRHRNLYIDKQTNE